MNLFLSEICAHAYFSRWSSFKSKSIFRQPNVYVTASRKLQKGDPYLLDTIDLVGCPLFRTSAHHASAEQVTQEDENVVF